MRWIRAVVLTLTLLVSTTGIFPQTSASFAQVTVGQLAPVTAPAFTPRPATEFIRRNPDFIQLLRDRRSPEPLDATPELLALLDRVNREGNSLIQWTDDRVTWGVSDTWDFPCEYDNALYDDCDSYSLWKMRRLIELGLPSTPLVLTLGSVETGGGHAVLVVRTRQGDYVLDNRFAEVKTLNEVVAHGYNLMWRQNAGDRMDRWVMLRRTLPALPVPEPTPPRPGPRPTVDPTVTNPGETFGPPLCIRRELG